MEEFDRNNITNLKVLPYFFILICFFFFGSGYSVLFVSQFYATGCPLFFWSETVWPLKL